jgi:TRAP-type C4-dicarboxylate transport system substrate-binding protein
MRDHLTRTGPALAAACALGFGLAGAADAATVLKFGHILDTGHPVQAGAEAMAAHVDACSGGGVTVEIYPGGQLGNESALNDQIRLGGVDFANSGASFLSRNYAPLGVSSVPYVFRDRDHALAYAKSDILRELMDGWGEAAGAILLSGYYSAAFHVFAQKGYPTPADLAGAKIRTPDAPAWQRFYLAVGANPIPIALGEVYLALSQGVVDGANLPLAVGYTYKLHEVAPVITLTFHQMEMAMLLTGQHVEAQLNDAEWACVQEGGEVYARTVEAGILEGEDALVTQMESEGTTFVQVDIPAYQAATASIIDDLVKSGEFTQELVDRIRAIQ